MTETVLFRPQFQAHHIFPKEIYKEFAEKFEKIGFKMHPDANGNKIMLATNKDMAAFIQKNPGAFAGANIGAAHHDNHLAMNGWLKDQIKKILGDTKGLSGDLLHQYQRGKLWDLHEKLSEMVRTGQPPLSKASGADKKAFAEYK